MFIDFVLSIFPAIIGFPLPETLEAWWQNECGGEWPGCTHKILQDRFPLVFTPSGAAKTSCEWKEVVGKLLCPKFIREWPRRSGFGRKNVSCGMYLGV
jgi:hypothetical protein